MAVPGNLQELLERRYGLSGSLERLLGERDRNYRLTDDEAGSFVVKIVDAAETELASDFQIQALRHLQASKCTVAVPEVVATTGGEFSTTIDSDGQRHLVRVVTWVDGLPMTAVEPDVHLSKELGAALATVDEALADFRHAGDRRELIWDMQNAARLRERAVSIANDDIRHDVDACFDAFEKNAEPRFSSIRNQVIHSDLNPANVLVTPGRPPSVAGIIDFSDMVRAPLVVDVAIAASYLRSTSDDPLEFIAPFVAGFDGVIALEDTEKEMLYDLVRTRLATTITMKYWRIAEAARDDPYLAQTLRDESDAEDFLRALDALGRDDFTRRVRAACGTRATRRDL